MTEISWELVFKIVGIVIGLIATPIGWIWKRHSDRMDRNERHGEETRSILDTHIAVTKILNEKIKDDLSDVKKGLADLTGKIDKVIDRQYQDGIAAAAATATQKTEFIMLMEQAIQRTLNAIKLLPGGHL